jgi:hypothetical protein
VQAGLISCHAGPAHLSRFAVTRRQQHPSSRFPSPVPERRRHHPCCRCRHHTTPHHTNPHPNPSSSAPPHHRRGRLLPSSQPPATPTPIAFASAPPRRARSVLPPPPTRPASSVGGRIWWLPRQARDLGLGGPLLPSSRASRERLRARVIVPRAPLFATVCLPRELSLPREGCRRSSVPRRITYRYASPSNPCPLRSSPFPDLAAW